MSFGAALADWVRAPCGSAVVRVCARVLGSILTCGTKTRAARQRLRTPCSCHHFTRLRCAHLHASARVAHECLHVHVHVLVWRLVVVVVVVCV